MDLTDSQWAFGEGSLPIDLVRRDGHGRPWSDRRKTLNGILWILRTVAPWKHRGAMARLRECTGASKGGARRARSRMNSRRITSAGEAEASCHATETPWPSTTTIPLVPLPRLVLPRQPPSFRRCERAVGEDLAPVQGLLLVESSHETTTDGFPYAPLFPVAQHPQNRLQHCLVIPARAARTRRCG